MASEPHAPSLLARFFDGFLQERNIKWMLSLGVFILLASSLLLVVPQWAESTPAWKFLVFLAYSLAIWLAGEWTYRRLGLRKTGTVLFGLTLLFIPILFLALGQTLQAHSLPVNSALAAAASAFGFVAARRILR